MTVKEILIAAAAELGMREDIENYLNDDSEEGATEAERLLRCFNLVENELALDYLPLQAEEEISSQTGAIYFSDLERKAVRVIGVLDRWENEIPYRLFPEYIKTQPGKVVVRYTYTPDEKGFDGESDYKLYASVRLFAYGIAAEYSLVRGLFEEAAVWDAKYKDSIKAAYRAGKGKRIKSRRWE